MKLAAVDTVTVVAWLRTDHVFHAAAVDALADWPQLVMHTVNLAEVLVGVERADWPKTKAALTGVGFTFHDTTADQMATARLDTRLKMPDACVIAVARARNASAVLTFDEKLRKAAVAERLAVNQTTEPPV